MSEITPISDVSGASVPGVEEVVPGSSNDPFSATPVAPSSASAPQLTTEGSAIPAGLEGHPAFANGTPNSQGQPVQEVSAAQPVPYDTAVDIEKVLAEAEQRLAAKFEEERRAQQSAADKRYNELQEQLKQEQQIRKEAERNAKLNADDLSDEEKDNLRRFWQLEDREEALRAAEAENEQFFLKTYVVALAEESAKFGVTAEALAAFTTPEEMDTYVREKELEYWRNGGKATAPAQQPVSTAPAGVNAPSDVSAAGAPPPPSNLRTDLGTDALRHNLSMGWETLRLPN